MEAAGRVVLTSRMPVLCFEAGDEFMTGSRDDMEVTGDALMPKRHGAHSAHFLTDVQI